MIVLPRCSFLRYRDSNFIVTFQEKGGKKWEYDEFFFQNQENAGESGSIAALRELSQKTKMNTVLQYYSFILKGVLFPNFILYYIYIFIYIYNIKFFRKKGDALK